MQDAGDLVNFERVVFGSLLVLVALTTSTNAVVQFTLPKLVAFHACLPAIAAVWALRLHRGAIAPLPRPILVVAVTLALWWVVTSLSAQLPYIAWHGAYGRYNGALTSLCCLALFLLLASFRGPVREIDMLARLVVAALAPVALYALLQYFGLFSTRYVGERPPSTIGNPVQVAAILGLALPFALNFALDAGRAAARTVWIIIFGVMAAAVLTTLARGPWIGIAVALAIVVIAAVRDGRLRARTVTYAVIALVMAGVVTIIARPAGARHMVDRVASFARLQQDATTLNRLIFYRAAVAMLRDHPLAGVGLENFGVSYSRYRPVDHGVVPRDVVPTMVHNGYLQMAVTTGVPGLLLYGALMVSVLVPLWRASRDCASPARSLGIACVAAITGYLVQDLTGWYELSLSVFFWFVAALAVRLSLAERSDTAPVRPAVRRAGYAAATAVAVFASLLALRSARELSADRLVFQTLSMSRDSEWSEIESHLDRVLALTRGNPHYVDVAGMEYAERVIAASDRAAYDKGVALFDEAMRGNPFDPYVVIHRLSLERTALSMGLISAAAPAVERHAQDLVRLDPNNPTVYDALAGLWAARGRVDKAREAMETSSALQH